MNQILTFSKEALYRVKSSFSHNLSSICFRSDILIYKFLFSFLHMAASNIFSFITLFLMCLNHPWDSSQFLLHCSYCTLYTVLLSLMCIPLLLRLHPQCYLFIFTRVKTVAVSEIFVFLQNVVQRRHPFGPQSMLIQWIKTDRRSTKLWHKCFWFPKSDLLTRSYQCCLGSSCLKLETLWICHCK